MFWMKELREKFWDNKMSCFIFFVYKTEKDGEIEKRTREVFHGKIKTE